MRVVLTSFKLPIFALLCFENYVPELYPFYIYNIFESSKIRITCNNRGFLTDGCSYNKTISIRNRVICFNSGGVYNLVEHGSILNSV